jgi:hypothetical protein
MAVLTKAMFVLAARMPARGGENIRTPHPRPFVSYRYYSTSRASGPAVSRRTDSVFVPPVRTQKKGAEKIPRTPPAPRPSG